MKSNLWDQAALYLAGAAVIATTFSISAFEVLMGLALVALLARRRAFRLPPVWVPLALFLFGTLISLVASGHIREGLPQVKKFYIYTMLFVIANAFRNEGEIRSVVYGFSSAAAISAAWGLRQFLVKYAAAQRLHQPFYAYYVNSRITGFSDHWMTFSGQLTISLLIIGAAVLLAKQRRWTSLLIGCAIPISVALVAAWTRSMWLGAFCGGLYLLWFWRRWAVIAVPCLLSVLLAANPFDIRERVVSAFSPHGNMDSNAHRGELRAIGWKMIQAHPWLGVGPEQVSRQVRNYLPSGMAGPRPGEYYGHLENDYIQYAAERGVPTMLCLMWMIGRALFDFGSTLRRLPANSEEKWVLHGAIAVTIAVLVSGFYSWNLNGSTVLAMFLSVFGFGYVVVLNSSKTR